MRLWPGMSARAEIFTSNNPEKIAVPIQAIISHSNTSAKDVNTNALGISRHYIFVNDQGKARRVEVLLGLSDDEHQEIAAVPPDTLSIGDQIILGPDRVLRYLKSGQKIVITPATSAR